jgi:hypothetical protein
MTNIQSYEQRVSRLTDARRNDSAAKRAAVLKAIADLRREDRRISRRVVIAAPACTAISSIGTKISAPSSTRPPADNGQTSIYVPKTESPATVRRA